MTPRQIEEYRALRDTIRQRGTTRVWVVLAGLGAWGALVVATFALAPFPAAAVLPLLILAAAFEIVFALHTGVERIGRYLQVFYEEAAGWEHMAMAYGRKYPGGGGDALFTNFFRIAAVVNFVPEAFSRAPWTEWAVVAVIHLLFIVRVAAARRQATGQREMDLQRFQELKRQAEQE